MIGRGEVTKAAQAHGVDAQTAERDYVLAHVAIHIAALGDEHLVLKGGTCLRLAHYEGYRYSADLDYSIQGIDSYGALSLIEEALDRCRNETGLSMLRLDRGADPPRIS